MGPGVGFKNHVGWSSDGHFFGHFLRSLFKSFLTVLTVLTVFNETVKILTPGPKKGRFLTPPFFDILGGS